MLRVYSIISMVIMAYVIFPGQTLADTQSLIQPSLTVSQEYTDNLFLTDEDEESEWITVVSPKLAYNVSGKDFNVDIAYAPGFTFYDDRDDLDSIRHRANLSISKQLGQHLTLRVTDVLTRTEEPYSRAERRKDRRDISELERETLRDLTDSTFENNREPRLSNTARTRLEYEFGPKDRIYVGYQHGLVEDDDPEESDSTRHIPEAGLRYWFTPHFGLDLSGSYTIADFTDDDKDRDPQDEDELRDRENDFDRWKGRARLIRNFSRFWDGYIQYIHTAMDFDDNGDEEGQGEGDYQVYEPSLGFDYRFSKIGSASLGLGYYYRDYDDDQDANDDDEAGFLINADIDLFWDYPRWSFELLGESGYEETYFGNQDLGFTIFYGAEASVNYLLTKRATTGLSLAYQYNEYTDEDPDRRDHVGSISGMINYQLLEWLYLNLSETFRLVDSNIDEEDYTENSVILSVTLEPRPLRY